MIIKERPSKYRLKYGKSLNEIADMFGVSISTVCFWCKNPKKERWMAQKIKEQK